MTSADVINGGAGVDTLNITMSGTGAGLGAPSLTSIEQINLRAAGVNMTSTDVSIFSGLTGFASDRSTGTTAVTGLAAGATVGMIGDGTVLNANASFAYGTATSAPTINVSGGTTGTTTNGSKDSILATAGTATSAVINSNGTAANRLDTVTLSGGTNTVTALTVNAAAKLTVATLTATDYAATAALTVTGTGAVSLGATAVGNFKTIDASASSGGLTIPLGTNLTSFKGSSGNDVVTTAAVTTTTASTVDAGAGTADVLNVGTATDVDSAAKGAVYANFEILKNSTNTDLDMSLFANSTFTALQLAGGAGATKMNATQAAAITTVADNDTLTLALATATGTSDVLSVTLANTTATASADLTTATVTGFETMNVVSSSGSSADINALSFAAAGDLTALNLSGAKPISVATANITKAATIDGSALSFVPAAGAYALTLSGNLVKNSVVNGSAAADSLTTTAAIAGTTGEFVTYNAGAGDDAITSTIAALNNTSAANGSVKIDGGAGTDTLTVDASTSYVDANFQYITNVEKLTVGEGATTVATGGFFNTNFATAGVTLTQTFGTSGGAGAASAYDLSTFTGKVTTAFTEKATGDVANVITVKTGSGDDTVVVTSNSAMTNTSATANLIQTGLGDDKITINAAALAATGKYTVNAGAGNDTVTANYAGAGLLQVTGGTGADSLVFSAGHTASKFNVNQGLGDSGTFAKPSTNTISTANFDVITGAKATDTITLLPFNGLTSVVTTINTGSDLSTATFANQTLTAVRGTYDASAKTFVGSATGADTLLAYDTTDGATITYEAVVLVGLTAVTSTTNAGVITL